MVLPPLVIDVRVREPGARGFHIWLPFFLLWPLLVVILVPALIVALIVDFALWISGARYHHYSLLLLGSLRLLAEIRGTHAHVDGTDGLVDVDIY